MKNKRLNFVVILALISVFALALAACSIDPAPEAHVCKDKCSVCGKCTSQCTDPVCADKCQGHAPVITVEPATITIHAGEEVELLMGVSATDPVDGNVNVIIEDDGDFDKDTEGEYTITYKATNSKGLSANATRVIKVEKALSALALEVRTNYLGETKWKGTKINFKHAEYVELSQSATLTKQSGVFRNVGTEAITLNVEGVYGCSAIITANGVVLEGRDGANRKLVNADNPTRAGSSATKLIVDGNEETVASAFAKSMVIPAGGYAIVIQIGFAGEGADNDGRGFMNYNVIYQYGNVVRLLWVDDETILTPYVNQAPVISGNTKLLVPVNAANFNFDEQVVKGIVAKDDNGTFATDDDVTVDVEIVDNGGFDITKEGTYVVKLRATDGTNAVDFTREIEVRSEGFAKIAIGNQEIIVLEEKVAVDMELTSVGAYSFIVYTPAYQGSLDFANGYGLAIVVSKYGKVVRVYDGANGKYFDATNPGGIQDSSKCDVNEYAKQAFASRQEGEYVVIAPNSSENNAEGGSRHWLNKAKLNSIGLNVVLMNVSFEELTYTITVGDKSFSATESKYAYNKDVTAAQAAGYSMIVYDKKYTGEVALNGYGAAIVLDAYGTLTKLYDGANLGFWTVDGKSAAGFTAANYATVAFANLADGEILIVFPNDGGANEARKFALGLRHLSETSTNYFGMQATLTGIDFDKEVANEIVIGDNKLDIDPAKVAVNTTTKTAADYSYYVFTTEFVGTPAFAANYGHAFVIKDGKIVRIYDGISPKYFDEENVKGVKLDTLTPNNYMEVALASLKANEWLLVAPNVGGDNTYRNFLTSNRVIGATLKLDCVDFTVSDKDFTSVLNVNGKVFVNAVAVVNAEVTKPGETDFAVYTYGYQGIVTKFGWSEAFVIDADGKVVRIYDGVNNKYFDKDNNGYDNGKETVKKFDIAAVSLSAFEALQPGETLLIGLNGGRNGNAGRGFLVGNRTIGIAVSFTGVTLPSPETTAVAYAKIIIAGKSFYVDSLKVAANANYDGTPAVAIYDYGFSGTAYTGGFGVAFVVDKATGKVVKVFDGASGKIFDEEHPGGQTNAGCTGAGYAAEAFAAMEEGQYIIIAPHGGTEGNAMRGFFYGNRKLDVEISYVLPQTIEE